MGWLPRSGQFAPVQSAAASDGLTFDRRGDRTMRRFAIARFA